MDTTHGDVSGVVFNLINGDTNADNRVSLLDLGLELSHWGRGGYTTWDLDGSGSVDAGDLEVVLRNFMMHGDD